MTRLEEVLTQFNAREANEKTIIKEFRKIAEVVFWGGYFLVNKKTRIYPVDIEFYLYGEKAREEAWIKHLGQLHGGIGRNTGQYNRSLEGENLRKKRPVILQIDEYN